MSNPRFNRNYKELRQKGYSKKHAKKMAGASTYGRKPKRYMGLRDGWMYKD